MKKHLFLLAFAVSALLPAATALAADLDPPPPPMEQLRPATYDWSGAYVGGWVGIACIDGSLHDYTQEAAVLAGTSTLPFDFLNAGCGGKGGVTAGYNHQIDNIVIGAEADWGRSGNIVENNEVGADYSFKLSQIATLRGRVGLALDDTLLFATAGGAWGRGELNGIVSAFPDQLQSNHYGWTVGGGIEHAVTDNIRIKLDYLYTRMNTANYYSTSCTATCDLDVKWAGEHEVRLGINYAF
jgi:outer membrane immunogenic protein